MASKTEALQDSFLLRMVGQAGMTLLASVAEWALRYFTFILAAAALGATVFGVYVLGLSIAGFCAMLARAGIDQGLVYCLPRQAASAESGKSKELISFSLSAVVLAGTVIAFLFVMPARTFMAGLFNSPQLQAEFLGFAAAIPLTAGLTVIAAALQAVRRFRSRSFLQGLIVPGISFLCLMIALSRSRDLHSAVVAQALGAGIGFAVGLGFLLKRRQLGSWRLKTLQGEKLFRTSFVFLGSDGVLFAVLWAETWLLGVFRGPEEVGIYTAGLRFAALCTALQVTFNTVLAPVIAELHHQKKQDSIVELFQLVTRWNLSAALPVALVLYFCGGDLLTAMGSRYVLGAGLLTWLLGAQLLDVVAGPVGMIVSMAGKPNWRMINLMISLGSMLLLGLLVIPHFGMMGAAVVNLTVSLMVNTIGLWQVHRMLSAQPFTALLIKPFFAAVLACAAVILFRQALPLSGLWLRLTATASVCMGTYFAALCAFRLERVDRRLVQRLFGRQLQPGA